MPYTLRVHETSTPRTARFLRRRGRRASTLVGAALALLLLAPAQPVSAAPDPDFPPAPAVVHGVGDDLFVGVELDYYCQRRSLFATGLDRIARLARLIERSGRDVVFTLAPGKTIVTPQLPRLGGILSPEHIECIREGRAEQRRLLDRYDDERFLPLRRALMADPGQTYWVTDLHWTSVGGAVFARELATRLDPRLGALQRYRKTTTTLVGVMNAVLDIQVPETAEAAVPASGVKVRATDGTPDWVRMPSVLFDQSWVSSPARRTWRGDTLIIGDSFTMYALENLRPLFRRGRFLWSGQTETTDVLRAIKQADTVVMEVYHSATGITQMRNNGFYHKVRRVLRHDLPH